eukprot:1158169-Pelagomonas_calceolata.AAC.4
MDACRVQQHSGAAHFTSSHLHNTLASTQLHTTPTCKHVHMNTCRGQQHSGAAEGQCRHSHGNAAMLQDRIG